MKSNMQGVLLILVVGVAALISFRAESANHEYRQRIEQLESLLAQKSKSANKESLPAGEVLVDKASIPSRAKHDIPHPVSHPVEGEVPSSEIPQAEDTKAQRNFLDYRTTAKISAIEKFVTISDDQRDRLIKKFRAKPDDEAESLDEILGEENATYYREQVAQAFERGQAEAVDKEVFYLSRKLTLSDAQEAQVRVIIEDVENMSNALQRHGAAKPDANDRISRMQQTLETIRLQQEVLAERMREVLTPEQYEQFAVYQSGSSDSDFSMLHSPPENDQWKKH